MNTNTVTTARIAERAVRTERAPPRRRDGARSVTSRLCRVQPRVKRGNAPAPVGSLVLYVMAIGYHAPISTTHTITSSILGAGATRGRKWVRWNTVGSILGAWVLTIPAAAVVAGTFFHVLRFLGMGN